MKLRESHLQGLLLALQFHNFIHAKLETGTGDKANVYKEATSLFFFFFVFFFFVFCFFHTYIPSSYLPSSPLDWLRPLVGSRDLPAPPPLVE